MTITRKQLLLAVSLALVVLVLCLIWRGCHARKVKPVSAPPQLSGLPTDSNDYTCAGAVPCATWAMPAPPAADSALTDPVYSTTSYRLAVPADSSTGNVIPMYSRVQAFNSDGTLMMLADGVTTDLYDSTTTPPRPIAPIKLSDGTSINGVDGDALWANTDPHTIYFNSPSGSVAGLQLRAVDVGACTPGNCVLTPRVLHTFVCVTDATSPLGAGVKGNKIETGSGAQGSMFDASDTYFSFSCDLLNGNGRNEIDMVRYNRQTDTVDKQVKWYTLCPDQTPTSCKVTAALPKGANLLRMNQSADAHYISIIWQTPSSVCPTAESKWARSCGTEIFDENYRFLGPASSYSAHQDMGRDVNGKPVFVSSSNSGTVRDYRALEVVDLTALDPTKINAKHFLLPCSFSYVGAPGSCDSGTYIGYAKSWHISMTAWAGRPGWGLFSTFMLAGQSLGAPRLPAATTLGTAVGAAGAATVTPADMGTIGPGVLSMIEYGNANSEMVTWTGTTATTATAAFMKPHPATAAVQCISCANTGWGAAELLALKIDAAAPDWSNFEFYRVGRTHAVRDANYNCEAHATVNRDFTQVVWGSSWDRDCDTNAQVTAYWMPLKAPAPPEPAAEACTAKLNADGTVITELNCKNVPVVPAAKKGK